MQKPNQQIIDLSFLVDDSFQQEKRYDIAPESDEIAIRLSEMAKYAFLYQEQNSHVFEGKGTEKVYSLLPDDIVMICTIQGERSAPLPRVDQMHIRLFSYNTHLNSTKKTIESAILQGYNNI